MADAHRESGSGSKTFRLVFTCKVCATRNMVEIQRKAWDAGTVIATCQGCNRKHVLADAAGLLDLSNWTKFSNVESSVEGARSVAGMGIAELAALGVGVDPATGSWTLLPRGNETVTVRKARVSSMGPVVDPALIAPPSCPEGVLGRAWTGAGGGGGGGSGDGLAAPGGAGGSVGARADAFARCLSVGLPSGVEGGDLLTLETGTGLMVVAVPAGAPPLSTLEVRPGLLCHFCARLYSLFFY